MPAVVSPVAGTRTEPKDGYVFIRGTTATFKIIITNNGVPIKPDTNTTPVAKILQPSFLAEGDNPIPAVLATLNGSFVSGQEFELQFSWDIPAGQTPLDNYIISYQAILGGQEFNFGDEFFTVTHSAGSIGTKEPSYATVDDIRKKKFNIDDYLPVQFKKDLTTRNQLIEDHLRDGTNRLREELNLNKSRGFSANYRLFVIYYAIWSILLAARGEDGSAVADQNLLFWRSEWERILAQEKREGVFQGVPVGRG